MNRIASLLCCACLLSGMGATTAAPRSHQAAAQLSVSPEQTAALTEVSKTLRFLEASVDSGAGAVEYGQAVTNLKTASAYLIEVKPRGLSSNRTAQLASALKRYQEAKDIWFACVRASRECPNSMINLAPPFSEPALLVRQFLADRPELDASSGRVNLDAVLTILWVEAKSFGKAYRDQAAP